VDRFKRFKRPFWETLFLKQNKYHTSSVIGHTLKVVYCLIKKGRWDLVPAGFLHDIAKPLSAYQDQEDIDDGLGFYSFKNHEAFGYHIIKNWYISDHTKNVVRYHYHIRGMKKAKEKGEYAKYRRLRKEWAKLNKNFKKDLSVFLVCDDQGKKGWFV